MLFGVATLEQCMHALHRLPAAARGPLPMVTNDTACTGPTTTTCCLPTQPHHEFAVGMACLRDECCCFSLHVFEALHVVLQLQLDLLLQLRLVLYVSIQSGLRSKAMAASIGSLPADLSRLSAWLLQHRHGSQHSPPLQDGSSIWAPKAGQPF